MYIIFLNSQRTYVYNRPENKKIFIHHSVYVYCFLSCAEHFTICRLFIESLSIFLAYLFHIFIYVYIYIYIYIEKVKYERSSSNDYDYNDDDDDDSTHKSVNTCSVHGKINVR